MDPYRLKRFNISKPDVIENRLIQGGFRYQKFNLSSAGELRIRNIGTRPTVDTTPIKDLPGHFECSDENISRIWTTGARTAQLTEIPQTVIPDYWIVSKQGSLVDSLSPQNYAKGSALVSYNVSVQVQPNTGAFTFGVLMDTLNNGLFIHVDVFGGTVTAALRMEGKAWQPPPSSLCNPPDRFLLRSVSAARHHRYGRQQGRRLFLPEQIHFRILRSRSTIRPFGRVQGPQSHRLGVRTDGVRQRPDQPHLFG